MWKFKGNCKKLCSFSHFLSYISRRVEKVTNMREMFYYCSILISVPNLNASENVNAYFNKIKKYFYICGRNYSVIKNNVL